MEHKDIMGILYKAKNDDNLTGGDIACGAALSSGKVEILVVAKDAKPQTKIKFGQLCYKYNVDFVTLGLCTEFCWVSGRKNVEIMAITDAEVADKVREYLEDSF